MPATVRDLAALLTARLDIDVLAYAEALVEAEALPGLDEPAGPQEAAALLMALLATENPEDAAAAAEGLGRAELAKFYTALETASGLEAWQQLDNKMLFEAPQDFRAGLVLEIGTRAHGRGVGQVGAVTANRSCNTALIEGAAGVQASPQQHAGPQALLHSRILFAPSSNIAKPPFQHMVQISGSVIDEIAAALRPDDAASFEDAIPPTIH